jgi:aspartate racemase
MKPVGIIGGIAPESTIQYYRIMMSAYRERKRDGSYPNILINSIDMKLMLDILGANDLLRLTDFLVGEVETLATAGAEFALFASNTPHIVFDEVQQRASVRLISIVEAACDAAFGLGLKKVGLFGTRFTMQGRFYKQVFSRCGIDVVLPSHEEQDYIHSKYMGELVAGVFLPETRDELLSISNRLQKQEGIDGLILGGTELPLLFREKNERNIPFLDTTMIHAFAAVEKMLA